MRPFKSLKSLFQRLHNDRRGAVSLETVLIIGAIALPILIVLIKFGWPRVRDYFYEGLDTLEDETDQTITNQ